MKKRVKFILVAFVVLVVGAGLAINKIRKEVLNKKMIKVSGNIEGDDVRISFRVAGQILELLTDEGKTVKKGELVARLDTDELTKTRDANLAALKAAEYDYNLAKIDYERSENLFKEGAVSAQKRDQDKTKFDASQANVDKLKANLELSETRLGFAELASPVNGSVVVKSALAGEYAQVGAPVFTVIDLNNVWVTGYVNEKDLGKVKLDQEAKVMTDSYPGKVYKARISFISDQTEFTPKNIQTTEERVKYVYRIKVKVDNSSLDLKPGMPADAYIALE